MQNTIEIIKEIQMEINQSKNNTRGYDHDQIFEAINRKLDAMLMIEEIKSKMAKQNQAVV